MLLLHVLLSEAGFVRMTLLAFWKQQVRVCCGTCWHQYCSLLSLKQKATMGGNNWPLFSSPSARTGSNKVRGNWAGPWVAGFMPEIAFAGFTEYFNLQWDPRSDSWRLAKLCRFWMLTVGRQQASPEESFQDFLQRRAGPTTQLVSQKA